MRVNKNGLMVFILLVVTFNLSGLGESVEKIYAVVNDEIITFSELDHFEKGMIAELKTQFQGEELEKAIQERKSSLLSMLIERKLVLSVAKGKNFDVEQYLEVVIKEIMEKNNIASLDDLKRAIEGSGLDYQEWRKIRKEELLSQSLIQSEVGSKIKIENSEIMAYYRANIDKFTKAAEISLNCIFLDKENIPDPGSLSQKMAAISAKLKENGAKFEDIARESSELPNAESNIFLGVFKKGELDAKIETAASQLKAGDYSDWIETANGWYIVQLVTYTESRVMDFKDIREEIETTLREGKLDAGIGDYIEQLKKDSYIKIYQEYK